MIASLRANHHSVNLHTVENRQDLFPLPSIEGDSHLHLVDPEGQLQVHTTPYRGSFSKVLSEALRTAGLGRRVIIAQFLKGGVDQGPEGGVRLCGRLDWLRPDIATCLTENVSTESCDTTNSKTTQAVREIWEVCKEHLLKGSLDQLVLDEIGLAIALGYLKEEDLISTLEKRPGGMDVILTGPSIPSQVISMADQVTELRCGH